MSKKINEPEKIVYGIGTGRCGTESLASLLKKQKLSKITHERYRWWLGWEHSESHVDTMLVREIKELDKDFVLYGDVAFAWLPYIPYIWRLKPEAKVVCLKRKKEDTVKSWLKTPYNHWQVHDGTKYPYGYWSRAFPKFDPSSNREKAVENYWNMYYERAEVLQFTNPYNFRIFDLNVLNSLEGQKSLLNFVGIEEENHLYQVGIRLNAATIPASTKSSS